MVPMGSLKKYQLIGYGRLAGYRKHIYMNVLFYSIDMIFEQSERPTLFNHVKKP